MIRVGIVGGGAAGLFAGCFLKREGVPFEVLEKGDRVGRKLLLTGHGRCNITNRKPPSMLKEGYHEAGNFIYRAISAFTPDDAVRFIEDELGVKLKEEENNRMFPGSDSASTIVDALVSYIGTDNIVTGFDCVSIAKEGGKFLIRSADGQTREYDRVMIATGGRSYPSTGSDGSGYALAESLGHEITETVPALTGIEVGEKDRAFVSSLAGVTVNVGAGLYYDERKRASGQGDLLFTHKGLSGPVIMELSREIPRDIGDSDGWIELDFTPGRREEELDRELLRQIDEKGNAKLTTLIADHVPGSVAEGIGQRAGVSGIRAAGCGRAARKAVIRELKHMELSVKAPAYETAYVTRGGVSLRGIRREDMGSRRCEGLYFAGEVADIDGISGGYNLQAAMSEAFIAVKGICRV